jgi:hypothetical protein
MQAIRDSYYWHIWEQQMEEEIVEKNGGALN